MELKKFNKDVYQIIEGGVVVAFAIRYSNEMWGLSDANDKKIVGGRFKKPKEVFEFFKSR